MIPLTRKQYDAIRKVLSTSPMLLNEFEACARPNWTWASYLPFIETHRIHPEAFYDIKMSLTRDQLKKVNQILHK